MAITLESSEGCEGQGMGGGRFIKLASHCASVMHYHYHTTHLESHRSREPRLCVHVMTYDIPPSLCIMFRTRLASKFSASPVGTVVGLGIELASHRA